MLTFERSHDLPLIRALIVDNWDQVSDDTSEPMESFVPPDHPSIWYVLVRHDENPIGLFMFERRGVEFLVHCCLIPGTGGFKAVRSLKEVLGWMWANSPARRITGSVPAYNARTLKQARLVGMKQFGVNEKAVLKHGKLEDLILFGISAPGI
jgi:hypothetical protein